MGLTERREQLLATDRWRDLRAFVERWYAHPLSDGDGFPPLEIERVAQRLGVRLPATLTEWYELVGRRLRDIQDSPTQLDELQVEQGMLRVWTENQGVWSIMTFLDDGDDPHCLLDDKSYDFPGTPLSHALLGMLVSDTLVGAWGGRRIGTLGELRPAVSGGYCENFTEAHLQQIGSSYEALDYARNPYFDQPYRGNAASIIRVQEVAIEWMTATHEAFEALNNVLELFPPDGDHEVVVVFDEESQGELPSLDAVRSVLASVGHVGQSRRAPLRSPSSKSCIRPARPTSCFLVEPQAE